MKIHRVVTMLGATTTTGRLASDMYDLNDKTYYSEAEGRDIPISHMDFQHMVRAFVKLCEQEDMLDRSKHMGTTKDLVAKIERLEGIIEEKDQDAMNTNKSWVDYAETLTRQKDMYKDMVKENSRLNGHYYTFSEIPQDEEGKEFIKNCKKYLNKESYAIRVRGQHLKKDLYGQGRAYHGANMEDSSHMRVYIDAKRGE